jgi:hypothetical protein
VLEIILEAEVKEQRQEIFDVTEDMDGRDEARP